MKKLLIICSAAAVVLLAAIVGISFNYKYKVQDVISVTGLGEEEFVSDLIVWNAEFSRSGMNLQDAYAALDNDRLEIKRHLTEKGLKENEFVFSFVSVNKVSEPVYSPSGGYMGAKFAGYRLTQNIRIESREVEKIELLSREMSEVIARGIALESYLPEYYYTRLADLKLKLIERATKDAHSRAKAITEKSGSKLGSLKNANMGVFQITAANSNEDYSWGGSYNTVSKNKKASITMKLEYHL